MIDVTRRKRKRRKRKLQIIAMPTTPQITKDSPVDILASAYAISIYWDNDENAYIAELSDFNSTQIHASTWEGAAAAAHIALSLLITGYRASGYTLPEVG